MQLQISERRAGSILNQARSTQRHFRQIPDDEEPLVARRHCIGKLVSNPLTVTCGMSC